MSNEDSNQFHFKIGWKKKHHKPAGADYVADGLKTILRLLDKSEGVNHTSCDYIYIHQVMPNGTIHEVYTHETGGLTTVDFRLNSGNNKTKSHGQTAVITAVGSILSNTSKDKKKNHKPHIRLKVPQKDERPYRTGGYRYKAYEAVSS
jgi:hypothetical protein